MGTLTNLSYKIDADGNITITGSGTNDPDGKIAKENAERKAKENREKEEKIKERRAAKRAEEEKLEAKSAEKHGTGVYNKGKKRQKGVRNISKERMGKARAFPR